MSDIAKGEFAKLAVDGNNHLTWAIDIEIELNGLCLMVKTSKWMRVRVNPLLMTSIYLGTCRNP
jgi:hypothetical protein